MDQHAFRPSTDYQKLQFIGQGSYGEVHKVQEKKTGQIFAMKRIKLGKQNDVPISAYNEINFLKSLCHENIVNFIEVVEDHIRQKIYLVLEFCETDLSYITENISCPFSEAEVKCIFLQLLSGLQYIHAQHIVHRDINPSNLLLKNYSLIKICDFGTAKHQDVRPLSPETGTLWYRALELLLGSSSYSSAVDIWASACVFIEMLTLKSLFPGRTEIEQINLIIDLLGTPNDKSMPGYSELPVIESFSLKVQPYNNLDEKFNTILGLFGLELLQGMLTYGQDTRMTAKECLNARYFHEQPLACSMKALKTRLVQELN